jgi:hypothetical protein
MYTCSCSAEDNCRAKGPYPAQGLFFFSGSRQSDPRHYRTRPPRQSDRRSLRSPQTGKHQAQSIAALTSAQSPHALGAGAASSGSRAERSLLGGRWPWLALAVPTRRQPSPLQVSLSRLLPPVLLFDSFLPDRRPPFSAWPRAAGGQQQQPSRRA